MFSGLKKTVQSAVTGPDDGKDPYAVGVENKSLLTSDNFSTSLRVVWCWVCNGGESEG